MMKRSTSAALFFLFLGPVLPIFAGEAKKQEIQVRESKRQYWVYTPSGYRKDTAYPAVLNLHGGGGNAHNAMLTTRMNSSADKHGYLALYPEGTGKKRLGKLFGVWNAGRCCGEAAKKNTDDIAYFSALLDDLPRHFNIDIRRIYVTGLSNGGMMAYQIACSLSERIAAIAPVGAGNVTRKCTLKRHVPTLHIHGTKDPCLPYNGGTGGNCFSKMLHKTIPLIPAKSETSKLSLPSIPESIKNWAVKNGLPENTKEIELYRKGKALCTTRKGTRSNEEVAFCKIEDGGHTWPGGSDGKICKRPKSRMCRLWKETVGPISGDLDANELIWNFFKRHRL